MKHHLRRPETSWLWEEKAAPTAVVVQLGALENADKVNEIVGKLCRLSVYTSPSTPAGKITRILVAEPKEAERIAG